MYRTIVLSVVLTLTAGPSAAALCSVWCHSPAVAAEGCHHTASTALTNVAADGCEDVALRAAAFVQEEVRRGVPAPEGARAVLTPRHPLAPTMTDGRNRQQSWLERALDKRPLPTILRI